MLVVSLLSPGLRNPTAFIGGQSSWVGTGSDATTCGRLSLLTNNTCPHALIRTCAGDTPELVIVMVASGAEGPAGDDVDPQWAARAAHDNRNGTPSVRRERASEPPRRATRERSSPVLVTLRF
jgi:hypothetical protein